MVRGYNSKEVGDSTASSFILKKTLNNNAANTTKIVFTASPGDERIELPPKVLETPIIPFDQSPVKPPNIYSI